MPYIIVESVETLPGVTLESYERANLISRELYNLTRPLRFQDESQKTAKVFPVIQHPKDGRGALEVDPEYLIPVHPEATLERLVALFPELTTAEREMLSFFILQVPAFPFGVIKPKHTEFRDRAYMVANGWIEEETL
jgi:hypothetical protein